MSGRTVLALCLFIIHCCNVVLVNSEDACRPGKSMWVTDLLSVATDPIVQGTMPSGENLLKGVRGYVEFASSIVAIIPVYGTVASAALGVFNAVLPTPESDDMKCLRQGFTKINKQLDVIEKKLESMEKTIIHTIRKATVYQSYRDSFRDNILHVQHAFREFLALPGNYTMTKLETSCLTHPPSFAIEWLKNRIVDDLIEPSLLPTIFNDVDCRKQNVLIWVATLFSEAVQAALMEQVCIGLYKNQMKTSSTMDKAKYDKLVQFLQQSSHLKEYGKATSQIMAEIDLDPDFQMIVNYTTRYFQQINEKVIQEEHLRQKRCWSVESLMKEKENNNFNARLNEAKGIGMSSLARFVWQKVTNELDTFEWTTCIALRTQFGRGLGLKWDHQNKWNHTTTVSVSCNWCGKYMATEIKSSVLVMNGLLCNRSQIREDGSYVATPKLKCWNSIAEAKMTCKDKNYKTCLKPNPAQPTKEEQFCFDKLTNDEIFDFDDRDVLDLEWYGKELMSG